MQVDEAFDQDFAGEDDPQYCRMYTTEVGSVLFVSFSSSTEVSELIVQYLLCHAFFILHVVQFSYIRPSIRIKIHRFLQ